MTGPNIRVGLDVGTTKVCALAAELTPKGAGILGLGMSPSTGLKKGMVTNIDSTVESIRKAVREAEASSGVKIRSVSVGISGCHIKGLDSSGAVGIRGKEVTRGDVARAIESAKAVYIPLDREVLHVVPSEFTLDGQEGITDPVGMSGVRLEAKVHIITGSVSSIQNLLKCCEKAGLGVADVVFEPLASAQAALTGDEKEFGVVLVDIGGGTTDLALFRDGTLRQAAVLGIGGNHLTNDMAVGFRISLPEAEKLKKASGAAYSGIAGPDEVSIPQAGGQMRTLPGNYIAEILQPRCEEMLELIKEEVRKCKGYEIAACGVVLTGGSSLLRGFDRMAESVLGLPVRIGSPAGVRGLKNMTEGPLYSTAVGLVTYHAVLAAEAALSQAAVPGIFEKMKEKFRELSVYTDYFSLNTKKEGGMLCLKSRK